MAIVEAHTSEPATGPRWDGQDYPYKPGPVLDVSEDLRFHVGRADSLDPITYEVISTKLWNINEEHADTIKRVSGSPVVVFNDDFNTCIMTETGEPFLFAPYIQYFTGAAEFIIKYTLENRAASPGIEAGDIFIHNDCFIGGSHQQDVGIYAPVFIGDELFCWVFNSCHVRDCGGVEPGSFCAQAPNIYYDPPSVRALKIADARGIRNDAEDTFLRMSRLPHLLAMEIRSQIAGILRARQRIEELVERYDPAVVKAVMHKTIDDTSEAVAERLRRLPDGRWSDVVYTSGAYPGDRDVHKQVLTLEKRGDRMYFDNFGTDKQIGCINCGFGQFRSAIGAALAQMLAFDHKYCIGGVYRLSEFDAEVGTITCVDRDGAVSALHSQLLTIYMATRVISRMIYPDAELRQTAMATSGISTCAWLTHSGTDQWGHPFATVSLDMVACGVGAFTFRDGIDQGGATFWPKSEVGDCEAWEQYFPVLYLYRRAPLNGGHGKYRGGHGVVFGWVGHDSPDQLYSTISIASGLPVQSGLHGGHWGQTGNFYGAQDTAVRDWFEQGRVPSSPEDLRALGGEGGPLQAKTMGLRLQDYDVAEMASNGAGGYGDPLEREPRAVAEDLRREVVTAQAARDVYGVVLGADGEADEAATADLRAQRRAGRLARAVAPAVAGGVAAEGELVVRCDLSPHLAIARDAAGRHFMTCTSCGTALCAAEQNYKNHVPRVDGSLHALDPGIFADPTKDVDTPIAYRTYVCASCGVAFENELAPADAEPAWDTLIDLASLERIAAD